MNTFGRNFRVTVFGESHGEEIGVVLDGVPAGLPLCPGDFTEDLNRRRSGARGTTPRREADTPRIVSGLYEGHATGAPLTIVFANGDTRSSDYSLFRDMPRPGHADYTAAIKWDGFNDPRGGGHFSARLTLPVTAAGVVAKKIVATAIEKEEAGVRAGLVEMGGQALPEGCAPVAGPEDELPEPWKSALESAMKDGDSIGGVVECRVGSPLIGLGEPFWDSTESLLSHAMFAIPGVRGVEFGDGFRAAAMRGSEHNDPIINADGDTSSNGAGGINGGITNGNPVVFRVAFKPTATIHKAQQTWNFAKEAVDTLSAPGRHDSCIALRAPVIVEAMAAIVLADLILV
ncbi:MAG: chorismate synthase [Bacteroidales bacterium]|nr:chorismate synthase [Bacteroidales bacterium]